jgi:DnaJ-class molecular chaperone
LTDRQPVNIPPEGIMFRRDYYLVLGVSRTAGAPEIRRAFKERALQRHPDRAGPAAVGDFQELTDAYHVLLDPASRAAYDSELRRAEEPRHGPVMDLRRDPERANVEPLVPPTVSSSLFGQFRAPHEVIDETFSRLFRNFTGWDVPKAERMRAIDVEVALSDTEAEAGAVLALGLPTFVVCPACEGAGTDGWYPCSVCGQAGVLEDEVPIELRIPEHVPDGAVIEAPLMSLGIGNALLRARIRVGHR